MKEFSSEYMDQVFGYNLVERKGDAAMSSMLMLTVGNTLAQKAVENYWTGKAADNGKTPEVEVGNYLAKKAPKQVTPGIRQLDGQYVDDLGRVQPWKAHYDEYGRLIGRTDYNAGNATQGIPDIHYHTYEW